MTDLTPLNQFAHHGMLASYHYADDSAKEWGMAVEEVSKAMLLYRAHPELRDAMRTTAENFLWALDFKRKAEAIDAEQEAT